VDMTGWYLTDEAGVANKWRFTAGPVLEPGDYAVIFASGKSDPSHPMHTNFQIKASGEYLELGLILPDQTVAHKYSLEYPAQGRDISYGLFDGELQYFAYPTPGEDNESGYFGIVADTKFSVDRGFYNQPISVAITCDEPNAIIRYTTDSEEPTEVSGTIYDQPIQISGTTVLKAIATKMGFISSNVDTHTYIFVSDVKHQSLNGEAPGSNWPSGDINGQYMNYGMDPEVVNNPVYSGLIEESLLSLPSISISTNSANLFSRNGIYANAKEDGIAWERPASMELIYPDGSEGFQIDMGLRIRGGWSRMANNPKHAFRCFFRGKYGDPKLKFPLFGEEGADEFDKVDLRAEQNYSWAFCNDARSTFVHEVFTRDTQGAMGQPYTRSRYYHLYLDGHYWGLYQTQERSEARYAGTYMGGDTDDYDVVKSDHGEISYTDGNLEAYERLYNAVITGFADNAVYFCLQGMNPDGTENPAYEKLLDVDNLIAYNLMCYYFGGIDYPLNLKKTTSLTLNNLYGIYNRNNPDGWKFFIHDAEHTFGLRMNNDRTYFYNFDVTPYNEFRYFNPVRLHQELFDNLEYRITFADAAYKHFFNGGALSEDECFERLYRRIAQVEPAIIAESARWGDAIKPFGENNNYTCGTRSGDPDDYRPATKAHWENAIDRLTNFMTGRTNTVFNWIKNRAQLHYPSIDPPVSYINGSPQHGGYISPGAALTMTNPNGSGKVYCTLDGSDPRLIGGALNPAASTMNHSTTKIINETTHVKARVKTGSTWSALNQAVYADDRIPDSLRISEIMYHPADPNTEFIELQNIGADAVNLNLVKFTNGIDFTFSDQTLPPGEYTVVVQDRPYFEARYGAGLNVAGQYAGRLDNNGERIEFQDAVGTVIQNFEFEDNWYELTDGPGYSLTMVDPASGDPNDWDRKFGWRSSLYSGGTPGRASETALAADSILINELLAHSHASAPDWIELYNATDEDINISGWFLSDDDSDPNMIRKYQIPPNTTILGGDYLVFVENDSFGDPTPDGNNIPFGLSEGGETVYLYSGHAGEVTGFYQTQQKFDASETSVTFGRYEKEELSGGYDFVRMTEPTPGRANTESSPLIPDIVITEIYYDPPNGTNYEFVELYNRSGHAVTLMTEVKTYISETSAITEWVSWRLEGTGLEFPNNTTIPAHSYIIVAKNPAHYSSALGPYDGKLDNGGEELEIQIPGDKGYGKKRYWIPIEKIDYDDESPWPKSPDGLGDSLHRININTYGRDYSNWTASAPTPGY
ncbi:MAG: lamin tail domain-containing protein, partial [Planctomycetota bacterium]